MKRLIIILAITLFIGCSNSPRIENYIGLDIKSEQIQLLIASLGKPEISKHEAIEPMAAITELKDGKIDTLLKGNDGSPPCTYYTFKEKGIEILFDDKNLVDAIFLYSEGESGNRQFQQKLPYDLMFTNTRKEIIDKLGKPDNTYAGSKEFKYNCSDSWNRIKGISITYNTTDSTDMSATISHMTISKPKDE